MSLGVGLLPRSALLVMRRTGPLIGSELQLIRGIVHYLSLFFEKHVELNSF